MFNIIDQKKFYLLGMGMFGVMSVYLIYGVIYRKAIWQHYTNSQTSQKQIFKSEPGFVFLEQFLSWILIEIFSCFLLKKTSNKNIPKKMTFICGLLAYLSLILFTFGIFELNERFSLSIKTITYFFVAVVGSWLTSFMLYKNKGTGYANIISSIGIIIGMFIFWIYAEQIWRYTRGKNGGFYHMIIIFSSACDGVLAALQGWICQKYKPSEIQLLLHVLRSTVICSCIHLLIYGDFYYTINYFFTHPQFIRTIISLSSLYFVGQFILYRIIVKMAIHVPVFIVTSKNIMLVHESYALSRHFLNKYQVIGMIISWFSVFMQAFLIVKKDKSIQQIDCLTTQLNKNKLMHGCEDQKQQGQKLFSEQKLY